MAACSLHNDVICIAMVVALPEKLMLSTCQQIGRLDVCVMGPNIFGHETMHCCVADLQAFDTDLYIKGPALHVDSRWLPTGTSIDTAIERGRRK